MIKRNFEEAFMKKIKIFAVVIVAIGVLGVALSVFLKDTDKTPEELRTNKLIVSKTVCYAYNYDTIEKITYVSHFIALARVEDSQLTGNRSDFAETAFKMTVIEPVYNCEKGEEFTLKAEGGETLTKIYKVEGEPLPRKGQELLVFCKINDDGTYSVINGAQGRLLFENERLNFLNSENTEGITDGTYSPLPVKNAALSEVVKEIKEYLTVSPLDTMKLDYNCKVFVEGIDSEEPYGTYQLSKTEKNKLVDYINNARISGEGTQDYRNYNGVRYIMFRIVKDNGEEYFVSSASPYIIIDGKGYECDKGTLVDIYNLFCEYIEENTDIEHIC